MGKTNFTKVEDILDQGLRKMMVEQLLDATASQADDLKSRQQLLSSLDRELKRLYKKDQKVYAKLEIERKVFKQMIDHPETLLPEDWEAVKEMKNRVEKYRAELLKEIPEVSNDHLVEHEREKSINKRFNVNEKWIPLY